MYGCTEADYPDNAIGDVYKGNTVCFLSTNPAGQIFRQSVSEVFLFWGRGGTVESKSTAGRLSLSCRYSMLPLVIHHFSSLLTCFKEGRVPCVSQKSIRLWAPLPTPPGKGSSTCFTFQNWRGGVADGNTGTYVLPLIRRIGFRRHTGESHFLPGLIQHFNLLQLLSTKSRSNRFCIINNSHDCD